VTSKPAGGNAVFVRFTPVNAVLPRARLLMAGTCAVTPATATEGTVIWIVSSAETVTFPTLTGPKESVNGVPLPLPLKGPML
jgi:hypothetical protein